MKFKMSPNSLFAILLRSPWWISFALVGLFSLAAAAVLPREYLFAGILGTFPFFAVGCVAAWRQWRAPSAARMA
ncbi:MAG: restriction endonuclease, partial [Burkholderiaceae bacterium]|nr:restriction endonuclease [Burkholderiaceae bacterium]